MGIRPGSSITYGVKLNKGEIKKFEDFNRKMNEKTTLSSSSFDMPDYLFIKAIENYWKYCKQRKHGRYMFANHITVPFLKRNSKSGKGSNTYFWKNWSKKKIEEMYKRGLRTTTKEYLTEHGLKDGKAHGLNRTHELIPDTYNIISLPDKEDGNNVLGYSTEYSYADEKDYTVYELLDGKNIKPLSIKCRGTLPWETGLFKVNGYWNMMNGQNMIGTIDYPSKEDKLKNEAKLNGYFSRKKDLIEYARYLYETYSSSPPYRNHNSGWNWEAIQYYWLADALYKSVCELIGIKYDVFRLNKYLIFTWH